MRAPRIVAVLVLIFAFVPIRGLAQGDTNPEPILRGQCERYASDPKSPWALAHGIVALGRDHKAATGKLAIDEIVTGYLEVESKDGKTHFTFPPTRQLKPIEPHVNLMVRTLVLAGVPMDRAFKTTSDRTVTLREMFEDVKARFVFVPRSDGFWSRMGWTLDAIGSQLSPAKATFVNEKGQTIDWREVEKAGFSWLEAQNAFFEEAMGRGEIRVEKRRQGIYSLTCGGFHLIQPLLLWSRHPDAKAAFGDRFDRQMKVLFFRLQSERMVYDEALQKAPEYRLALLVQQLKFFGHWLETMGRLAQAGAFVPDAEQRNKIVLARALLAQAVRRLADEKAFESMEAYKKESFQTYLDLIGDSCHALNGWVLTTRLVETASAPKAQLPKTPAN